MKAHELTQEQIEWGKNNPLTLDKLTEEQRGVFDVVGKPNCEWHDGREWVSLEGAKFGFVPEYRYRIRPDYEKPEEPKNNTKTPYGDIKEMTHLALDMCKNNDRPIALAEPLVVRHFNQLINIAPFTMLDEDGEFVPCPEGQTIKINEVYRVADSYFPDHLKPEETKPEKWIECEVDEVDGWWCFKHLQQTLNLSEAPGIVGFGGVLFEGVKHDYRWYMGISVYLTSNGVPYYLQNDDTTVATPRKVRFLNPEYKGD